MFPIVQNRDLRVIDRDSHFEVSASDLSSASDSHATTVKVRYRNVVNSTHGSVCVRDSPTLPANKRISYGVLMQGPRAGGGAEAYAVNASGIVAHRDAMPMVTVAVVPDGTTYTAIGSQVDVEEDRIIVAGTSGFFFNTLDCHEVISLGAGSITTDVTFCFMISFAAIATTSCMMGGNLSVQRLVGPWKQGSGTAG